MTPRNRRASVVDPSNSGRRDAKPHELRRTAAFVDALIADRRPPRFRATDAEAQALRTAVSLRGAAAHEGPAPDFIDDLARRLRAAEAAPGDDPADPSRRALLKIAGLAAAPAAAGVVGDRLATARPAAATQPPHAAEALVPDGGRWTAVARFDDLRPGQPIRFTAGALEGFLIRNGDGVDALSAVCTHQGCILFASGSQLECPCHRASFALSGQVIDAEYALPPLPSIRTRLNAGTVEVLAT